MQWPGFRVIGVMTVPIVPVSAVAVPFRHRDVRRSDDAAAAPARAQLVQAPREPARLPGDDAARALLAASVLAGPDPWAAAAARAAYRSAGRLGLVAAPRLKSVA